LRILQDSAQIPFISSQITFDKLKLLSKENYSTLLPEVFQNLFVKDSYVVSDGRYHLRHKTYDCANNYKSPSYVRLQHNPSFIKVQQENSFNDLNFSKNQEDLLGIFCLLPFSLSSEDFLYFCDKLKLTTSESNQLIASEWIFKTTNFDYSNIYLEIILGISNLHEINSNPPLQICTGNKTDIESDSLFSSGIIHRFYEDGSYGYFISSLLRNRIIYNFSKINYLNLLNCIREYYESVKKNESYIDRLEKLFVKYLLCSIEKTTFHEDSPKLNHENDANPETRQMNYYSQILRKRFCLELQTRLIYQNLYACFNHAFNISIPISFPTSKEVVPVKTLSVIDG